MRRQFLLLSTFAVLSWSGSAMAACPNVATDKQQDLNECAATTLAEADGALNALYRRLMEQLSPKAKASLRLTQRAWLAYREAECEFESIAVEGGSMRPMVRGACLSTLTQSRIKDFRFQLTCTSGDAACAREAGE